MNNAALLGLGVLAIARFTILACEMTHRTDAAPINNVHGLHRLQPCLLIALSKILACAVMLLCCISRIKGARFAHALWQWRITTRTSSSQRASNDSTHLPPQVGPPTCFIGLRRLTGLTRCLAADELNIFQRTNYNCKAGCCAS